MILFGILIITMLFGFVVFFGAPNLPTLKTQSEEALNLLNLKPGQTLLELGSGDGRVMRKAAERGLVVTGYELNPILVVISKITTWKYRKQVTVNWGNFWKKQWPATDAVFVFLLDKYMPKLDERLKQTKKPVKLLSYTFKIPGKKPVKQSKGLFLYLYK